MFTINSNTTLNVSGNDFSKLTTPNGLVAAGDPSATINVSGNYWGTTVAGIDAIIDDHNDNSNLPTVNFQPYVNYSSGTSASPVDKDFQHQLADVQSYRDRDNHCRLRDQRGNRDICDLQWNDADRTNHKSVQVQNGSATASYTLPAGTPVGLYTIAAYYSGSADNYLPVDGYQPLPDCQSRVNQHDRQ